MPDPLLFLPRELEAIQTARNVLLENFGEVMTDTVTPQVTRRR